MGRERRGVKDFFKRHETVYLFTEKLVWVFILSVFFQ